MFYYLGTQQSTRRVWIYQRGNQNPYIEEGQTTQWPKEKVQKDKQWSTIQLFSDNEKQIRARVLQWVR